MMWSSSPWRVAASALLVCGLACSDSDDDAEINPGAELDLAGFELDAAEKQAVEKVQKSAQGEGAAGSYAYDETAKKLTLTFASSSFQCDGPQKGQTLTATVTELTATRLSWDEGEGGDSMTWTRVDAGTEGLTGVWKAGEAGNEFFLVIDGDGVATVIGEEKCGNNGGDVKRNDRRCVELGLFGATIATDGDLSDWSAVGGSATIEDERGDHGGGDDGGDLRAMKVEIQGDALNVLMQLYGAPNTEFQARQPPNDAVYRLHVESATGSPFYSRIAYSPEAGAWQIIDPAEDRDVAIGVGPDGVEWSVALSKLGNDPALPLIRLEVIGCGTEGQPCGTLDEIDNCGYLPGL